MGSPAMNFIILTSLLFLSSLALTQGKGDGEIMTSVFLFLCLAPTLIKQKT